MRTAEPAAAPEAGPHHSRIPVVDVAPVVDDGDRPVKSVVGEEFEVTATVFREGHDMQVFSKARRVHDRADVVIIVANLDPSRTRDTWIHLSMPDLGLGWQDAFVAHDLITGQHWNGAEHAFVRLGPETEPVHIIRVQRY